MSKVDLDIKVASLQLSPSREYLA